MSKKFRKPAPLQSGTAQPPAGAPAAVVPPAPAAPSRKSVLHGSIPHVAGQTPTSLPKQAVPGGQVAAMLQQQQGGSGAPPQGGNPAQPQGDPDSSDPAIAQVQDKVRQSIPPQYRVAVQRVVMAGLKVMYDPQTHHLMVSALQ